VKQNYLGTLRVVVPAQIIGDLDGQWDRNAYKTDAFYGNPLSGFVAPYLLVRFRRHNSLEQRISQSSFIS